MPPAATGRALLAFKASTFGKGLLAFVIGGLTLIAGAMIVTQPLLGLATMTLVLALYFIVDGLTEIVVAFQKKPSEGWGWLLFTGCVSLVLGILIWMQWPLSGARAVGVLVGFKLLFVGSAELALAGALRRAGRTA